MTVNEHADSHFGNAHPNTFYILSAAFRDFSWLTLLPNLLYMILTNDSLPKLLKLLSRLSSSQLLIKFLAPSLQLFCRVCPFWFYGHWAYKVLRDNWDDDISLKNFEECFLWMLFFVGLHVGFVCYFIHRYENWSRKINRTIVLGAAVMVIFFAVLLYASTDNASAFTLFQILMFFLSLVCIVYIMMQDPHAHLSLFIGALGWISFSFLAVLASIKFSEHHHSDFGFLDYFFLFFIDL